jgi:hypothetical protein
MDVKLGFSQEAKDSEKAAGLYADIHVEAHRGGGGGPKF